MVEPVLGHESYRGRLAIPYLTESGPINMVFRCLRNHKCKESGCPKYLKSEGWPTNLYNVQAYYDAYDTIIITEGELDALVLSYVVGMPAIAVPGAKNWKKSWNLIFGDFPKVFVYSDGDEAGQEFASRVASEIQAINIEMPSGMDVNDAYLKLGADYLRERIA